MLARIVVEGNVDVAVDVDIDVDCVQVNQLESGGPVTNGVFGPYRLPE